MEICKKFSVEGAHIVRGCSTHRCSHSMHAHGAQIDVYLSSDKLDNGAMICDFGLMKTNIKMFIDSFDHCFAIWEKDDEKFKDFVKEYNDRWIELPISPSAEGLSLLMVYFINKILKATKFNNGEGNVVCTKVTWHETTTGSATAFLHDLNMLPAKLPCTFSEGVVRDWSEEMVEFITDMLLLNKGEYFINPAIEQQVK